ncbi:MAG: cell division ATP-binding protein FtsE [Oscillospiraceae bacterium]|nr:cell division ATP-binding protein FtsE [Oscillospiraceae bacterium]
MIQFTDVVKTYAQGNNALNGVTMQIEDGEFVFLIGPSGSGKSTIIKLITGELKPTSGTVHVNGYSLERIRKREIPYLRRTVGVVFQDFRLIDKMTVYENVAFAMRVVGAREREIRERVPYVLELVGLESKMNRHPNEMSGGEQQRLAIARALVNNPSTIIADEPTGNLDPERSFEIMALLQEINNLGTTVLVVSHDQKLVDLFGKRVIAIDEGLVVRDDGEEEDELDLVMEEEEETDEAE